MANPQSLRFNLDGTAHADPRTICPIHYVQFSDKKDYLEGFAYGWWYADEGEQLNGPYLSFELARDAYIQYGKEVLRDSKELILLVQHDFDSNDNHNPRSETNVGLFTSEEAARMHIETMGVRTYKAWVERAFINFPRWGFVPMKVIA